MLKKRDIAVSTILTIVTCGIYGIYWYITLTDDVGQVSEDRSISGGVAFLLKLVTCGIYGFYWAYKMGQNIETAKRNRGVISGGSDMAVVYLILQIFGLEIVNLALMQNELNKMEY